MRIILRISRGGFLVIPKKVREIAGVDEGTLVVIEAEKGLIKIMPLNSEDTSVFSKLEGEKSMLKELCSEGGDKGFLGSKIDWTKLLGLPRIKFRIYPIWDQSKYKEVEGFIDTKTVMCIIPRRILEELNIRPARKQRISIGALGVEVMRDIGHAIIEIEVKGERMMTSCDVVFGEDEDPILLGYVPLEHLGLRIDPKTGEIIKDIAFL